jgi:uncharacterized protein YdaU (DUF1376 family)
MNYYSHHIGDFNNATIHLTEIEECMYHRALAWYYSNEKPLPKNKVQTYRFLRARTAATKAAVDAILDDFFVEQEDGFHQSRCDEEIAAYKEKAEVASKAGKASAAKRAEKSSTDDKQALNDESTGVQPDFNAASTDVQRTLNGTSTNQEPITNNQEPIKNNTQDASEFAPDLNALNDMLKMAGATTITKDRLNQVLVTFTPHYETHHLTDNQRMGKLVQWIKGDQSKPTHTPKTKAAKPIHGNVNDAWGNPPAQDLDNGYVMPDELKAKIAALSKVKVSP